MSPQERFWVKVDRREPDECWPWIASLDTHGYGQFNSGSGRIVKAHRFSYEQMVGPIPEGLALDHLCRVRHCVNPAHLEPVTNAENSHRAVGLNNRPECKNGHPLVESNIKWKTRKGRPERRCLICHQEQEVTYRARRTALQRERRRRQRALRV